MCFGQKMLYICILYSAIIIFALKYRDRISVLPVVVYKCLGDIFKVPLVSSNDTRQIAIKIT